MKNNKVFKLKLQNAQRDLRAIKKEKRVNGACDSNLSQELRAKRREVRFTALISRQQPTGLRRNLFGEK